jgi:hypothetical protein
MSKENRSNELIRLIYCSTATFASQEGTSGVEKEVARILMESRRNNPKLELGGVLHYGNGCFFQALEGKRKLVNERYEKIVNDARHRDVELLSVQRIDERLFPDWSMKYVAVEEKIRDLLAESGLTEFNPYSFDEAFCDRLIRCFVEQRDASERPKGQPGNRVEPASVRPSLWQRLFGT